MAIEKKGIQILEDIEQNATRQLITISKEDFVDCMEVRCCYKDVKSQE